jgi:hypothetical protein
VGQFRASCAGGQPPPFSTPPTRGGPQTLGARPPLGPSAQPRPTAAPSAWPRGDAFGPGLLASSSSCPCWPGSTSTTSFAGQATPARA